MVMMYNSPSYNADRVNFAAVKAASIGSIERLVRVWLPSGHREGDEWETINPKRGDKTPGSFKINLKSGLWSDFATGDAGGDMIDLHQYLYGSTPLDAAREVGKLLGVGPAPNHAQRDRRAADETPATATAAPKEPGAFPPRTPPGADGKPHFVEAGETGPERRDDELRRHVYRNGAVAVRIKIMRSGEPRATNWYRVADGKTTGWQSGKPEGFKAGPYVGARDPFCADQASEPLWWPEGEKDVESLADKGGLAFTFGGTGDGLPEGCEEYTRGRDVVILADNDRPGVEHAKKKADRAAPVAKSVRVVPFPDLPEHGDVTDFFERGGTFADLQKIAAETPLHKLPEADCAAAKPLIQAKPFVLRDPKTLPRRDWIYGRHLIRKFGSATFAPSGSGKTNTFVVEALAIATGRDLLGIMPPKRCRVWLWNGEDPMDELERRVGAACLHYKITPEELKGWLFINSGRDKDSKLVIASQSRVGVTIAVPVVEALIQTIKDNKIDVVMIDPFISSHNVTENDNNAIDAVAKEWTGIADATNTAIDLGHHTRKTGGAEVTVEDGRGAVALLSAVRPARVLNVMTEDEAAKAGVTDGRKRYFRITDGKNNNALPIDKMEWYRSATVNLGNGGDPGNLLDTGDDMGVVTKWEWPDPLAGMTGAHFDKAAATIRAGKWRKNTQANDWVGKAIAKALELDLNNKADKAKVAGLIRAWLASGALVEVAGKDAKRNDRLFIEVAEEV